MIRAAGVLLALLIGIAVPYCHGVRGDPSGEVADLVDRMRGAPAPVEDAKSLFAQSQRVIRSAPIYARAFFVAGVSKEQMGELPLAARLVDRSIALTRRIPEARFWSGMKQLEAGKSGEAVDTFAGLYDVSNQIAPLIAAILAETAKDAEVRARIASRLANRPQILEVLRQAELAGLQPTELQGLLAKTDLRRLPDGVRRAQEIMISRSLAAGDLPSAYSQWRALLPGEADPNPVFDGDFLDKHASPPFIWKLAGRSDITWRRFSPGPPGHSGAIEFTSFGTAPIAVAEQALVLQPGEYVLRAVVRTPSPQGSDGQFQWRVECGSALLVQQAISPAPAWQAQEMRLDIPSGCRAQTLKLESLSSGSAAERSLQISGVALYPSARHP